MKRFLFVTLLIAGCKQGIGDRCQVEADCETGLVCNQADMKCQATGSKPEDAMVPDAPKGDGGVDATTDAPRDATLGG